MRREALPVTQQSFLLQDASREGVQQVVHRLNLTHESLHQRLDILAELHAALPYVADVVEAVVASACVHQAHQLWVELLGSRPNGGSPRLPNPIVYQVLVRLARVVTRETFFNEKVETFWKVMSRESSVYRSTSNAPVRVRLRSTEAPLRAELSKESHKILSSD